MSDHDSANTKPPPLAQVIPLARKPWPELVEYLREKLTQAEDGQLAAIVLAFEYEGGETGHYAFNAEDSWPGKLVGEMQFAQHQMVVRECARRSAKVTP